ncbi:MAG: S-layer homology domain-containing protein [Armatimonadota bacterium]|nr:S-layer homology domain-containing protein [Armatimonadota bacterium]
MKKAALFVTAALLLALVAPVFAQPFADVPTDHWAYDAIAELAAKGLVEGYPDGTFKGDRALTRYEMAMIVARLLARIEAVAAQIPGPPPPPPAPEVRKADIDALRSSIDTINRLVREFQTDLQALGVRIESIEEELRTLRGQLDKTKITGDVRIRYTSAVNAAASANFRTRLTFSGQVAPNVKLTARMLIGTFTFATPSAAANVTFDRAYFDMTGLLGLFNLRIGRQYDLLGPIGLLFDAGNTGIGVVDGAKVSTTFAGVGISAFAYQDTSAAAPPNRVLYGGRAEFSFIPGWTFGLNAYSERDITASTASAGYGLTVSGALLEGLSFSGEVISFTPSGGTARSGYQAGLSLDFNKLTGAETAFAPTFGLSYRNFDFGGAANAPLYGSVYDYNGDNKGDFRGWRAEMGLTLTPTVSFNTVYESGNKISTGATVANLDVYTTFSLAPNTSLKVQYYRATVGGSDTANFYRLELTYSW